MDIAINIDHSYLQYAIVMLESFFCHNRDEEIVIHLLYSSMEGEDLRQLEYFINKYQGKLRTYRVDQTLFYGFPNLKRWSVETLFRLLIPEILPESIRKVLYLDADLIVEKSLRPLYSMVFCGKSMIVCRNMDGTVSEIEKNRLWQRELNIPYFNAGVMLMNLEKMRESCCFQKYCHAVRKNHGLFPLLDQDLLNYFFGEDVQYVPAEKYNCVISPESREFGGETAIYHFGTAEKPWQKKNNETYYEIWWRYAREAGFVQLKGEKNYVQMFSVWE